MVPATLEGDQDVLLSDEEFVLRKILPMLWKKHMVVVSLI